MHRFPSSINASKQSKSGATPAKGSLISGRQSPPLRETPLQPLREVDSVCLGPYLSISLYSLSSSSSCSDQHLSNVHRTSQPYCILLCGSFELFFLKKLQKGSMHTIYSGEVSFCHLMVLPLVVAFSSSDCFL